MGSRYPRLGEAIRVVCWTGLIAGMFCALFSSLAGGGAAWAALWTGVVLAAAWFYVADRRGWPFRHTTSVQAALVGVGLAATLAVAGAGRRYPLIVLGFTGFLAATAWFSDDGSDADLGGPVD
ncbi:hypothetical protein Val02_82590 [Virgisporangium aliadipatigenens]|uniref:Uncharacterized protein n=1 Tax=Virgisporangium aliadipatigenens TaxID=741659 RepID=A0A8J4DVN7_9ACTN|nr:hypothetical protein [Virgisporangium aliadipatigenens]GIJ51373.1 hypothetical protein Val02_82590 [Virgisporangium aliadipatigenens]